MSEPIEVTTVPREDGRCVLAFIVLARSGDWAIGQTAHAGLDFGEKGTYNPSPLAPPKLTWMVPGGEYGRCLPLYDSSWGDLVEAMECVQGLSPAYLIAAAKDQDERGVQCRPFRLEHLREMLAHWSDASLRRSERVSCGFSFRYRHSEKVRGQR